MHKSAFNGPKRTCLFNMVIFVCVFALWLGGYMALIFHILNKKREEKAQHCVYVPGSVDAPAHEHRESSAGNS